MKFNHLFVFFLVLIIFGCSKQENVKKRISKTENLLSELKKLGRDSSNYDQIQISILKLIDNRGYLINYSNSAKNFVEKVDDTKIKINKTIESIDKALIDLIEEKESFRVKRKELFIDTLRHKCNTDFLPSVSFFNIPKNSRITRPIFEKQHSEIPIFFHILEHSDGRGAIKELENSLQEQIDSLNAHFKEANGSFVLEGYILYKGKKGNKINWYFTKIMDGYKNDKNKLLIDSMLSEMAIEPERVLNVYTGYSGVIGGNIGLASLPDAETVGTFRDFVFTAPETLPNQPKLQYAYEGKTLTHEIGHYLGLLHIFDMNGICWEAAIYPKCWEDNYNGCSSCFVGGQVAYNGDFIEDTPPQSNCYFDFECCNSLCKDCLNKDNVLSSNFMGYNDDSCMKNFTKEQNQRMNEIIFNYRNHYITKSIFN